MVKLIMTFHPGMALEHAENVAARLYSFEQPLLSIGAVLSEQMAINFARAPWPPLKDSTKRLKARRGYPADPLVRTGAMKGSATDALWQSGRLGGGSFMAVLETPGYSAYHMPKGEGGFGPTRFMPVRDFAFIDDSVSPKVQDIVVDWLSS